MKIMTTGLTLVLIGAACTYSPAGALGLIVCVLAGLAIGGFDRLMQHIAESK